MILDRTSRMMMYSSVHKDLKKAFKFLANTDFSNAQEGAYNIKNTGILASIVAYDLHQVVDPMLERHKKHIDLQMIISGYELVGYEPFNEQECIKPYDSRNDYEYFEGNPSYFRLEPGMFALFFPDDLHMPGICIDCPVHVKKVILKIKV